MIHVKKFRGSHFFSIGKNWIPASKVKQGFLFFTLLVTGISGFSPVWPSTDKVLAPIVEKVQVVNVQIPVRVYAGKEPVANLTKEDFELFVNGKRKEINGFFEKRRKLTTNIGQTQRHHYLMEDTSRLFVLIFNVSDFQQDLAVILDTFFDSVVKSGDRIMAITNHHFLPERRIENPAEMKEELIQFIHKEQRTIKFEVLHLEMALKALISLTKSRLSNRERDIYSIIREFLIEYGLIVGDMRDLCLGLPYNEYIKVARYLEGQKVDKWVINFYQVNRVPMLDTFGTIGALIESVKTDESGVLATQIKALDGDFRLGINNIDQQAMTDITKTFLQSGATFYTMQIKPVRMFSEWQEMNYQPVPVASENILKQLTRWTGGRVVKSNRVSDFIDHITAREDIVYTLTYVPEGQKYKNARVDVKVKNQRLRVVFDNQRRMKFFRDQLKEFEKDYTEIEIDKVNLDGDLLTVHLSNINLVRHEEGTTGIVYVRVKIFDNREKMVANFEKKYQGKEKKGLFQTRLPNLIRGQYSILLEVRDMYSLSDNLYGYSLDIAR